MGRLRLRTFIHGIRVGWKQSHCEHPTMSRITVVAVGETYAVGGWHCPDCGKTLTDMPEQTWTAHQ